MEEDSSHKQSSVVMKLTVEDEDVGIDSIEDEGTDSDMLILEEKIISDEEVDGEEETSDDCRELLESFDIELETSEDDNDVEQTWLGEELEDELDMRELGKEEEEVIEEERVDDK
jgi:hypothetical protein